MKKLTILFLLTLYHGASQAQQSTPQIPNIRLQDLNGQETFANNIANNGKPIVISFWATWCKPCILELNELQDIYEQWHEETGVKIVAISIDDARGAQKVPAIVRGRGWEFDVYLDENSDLKRALNIANIPYSLLVDGQGSIVWQHSGYTLGDEEILYEEILKIR